MSAAKSPTIAFVIPCYNEQAGIQHTLTCLLADIAKLEKSKAISPKSYVALVDDGSTDAVISLDADLQDDMSVVSKMIEHFSSGTEIVFAVRRQRSSDSRFKRR